MKGTISSQSPAEKISTPTSPDQTKHTPTPSWRDLFPISCGEIGHEYGDLTLLSADIKAPVAYIQGPINSASVRECSEFIVQACNSHEELVAVAKSAAALVKAFEGIAFDFRMHAPLKALGDVAEAALEKAGVKP